MFILLSAAILRLKKKHKPKRSTQYSASYSQRIPKLVWQLFRHGLSTRTWIARWRNSTFITVFNHESGCSRFVCWLMELLYSGCWSFTTSETSQAAPLSYSGFLRYWEKDAPTLRITKSGSDFCDFCTTIKSSVACLQGGEEHLNTLRDVLEQHRKEAKEEFLFYKHCQHQAHVNPNGRMQHFVFDFAEKVLLPKLLSNQASSTS